MIEELVRRITLLERRVGNLVEPEFPRWLDWTPTLDQGGAVAATVTFARYTVGVDRVSVEARLAVTAAGVAANAISISGVPAAIQPTNAASGTHIIGTATVFDAGTTVYVGALIVNGANDWRIRIDQAGTNYLGVTPALTLANGDAVGFVATYER